MKVNNDLSLDLGNASWSKELGQYHQNLKPAIYHYENDYLGEFDDDGIPYLVDGERRYYNFVYVIQYCLILHDHLLQGSRGPEFRERLLNCVHWLQAKSETLSGAVVWKSPPNEHYGLKEGWISGMYQGQALSLFLRIYQLTGDSSYLDFARSIWPYFKLEFDQGGSKRIDDLGCIWFEEYPCDPPSFVMNGFAYASLGILDLYRVTGDEEVKDLFNQCVKTLELNMPRFHRSYWSIYGLGSKQLVSYYYQKNVHIPLMDIFYELTGNKVFKHYAQLWRRQLNSAFFRAFVQIMYRVQPKLLKLFPNSNV